MIVNVQTTPIRMLQIMATSRYEMKARETERFGLTELYKYFSASSLLQQIDQKHMIGERSASAVRNRHGCVRMQKS